MKILYITYIDFGEFNSASSVRPQKIYNAFQQLDIEVKLLSCQQNKRNERKKAVKETLDWLKNNIPDICYVELPSGPIFNCIDLKLLKKLHKMKIPTAVFYRDIYWAFPDKNLKKSAIDLIKSKVVKFMHLRDMRVFNKCVDIMYIPSETMSPYVKFNKIKKPLPPACDIQEVGQDKTDNTLTAIYVGGVSERYGTYIMLEAFKKLNEKGINVKFNLICRDFEWKNLKNHQEYENEKFLNIIHTDDRLELEKIYNKSDFAICPIQKTIYNDFAVPVKIFEYIAYEKPILATNCVETEKIIVSLDIGLIAKDTSESMCDEINKLMKDKSLLDKYKKNVKIAKEQNQWINRAQVVIDDLLKIGER